MVWEGERPMTLLADDFPMRLAPPPDPTRKTPIPE